VNIWFIVLKSESFDTLDDLLGSKVVTEKQQNN